MSSRKRLKMTDEQWMAVADEARRSGRSLSAQAQMLGISPKALYKARWRLRQQGLELPEARKVPSASTFIPVQLSSSLALRLCARLGNGVEVECTADDQASLQWWLVQLASLPCSI